MANFSLDDVKALREQLGTGMVATKNALQEADGDREKAIEILRLKGAKGNAKRADRSASEGLVAARDNGDGSATLVELNSETDFVAKGAKFIGLANEILEIVADARAADVPNALELVRDGTSVADRIGEAAAVFGEKLELRSVKLVQGPKIDIYLHRTSKDLPPQVGVALGYEGDDAELARSISQHIAFADPRYLTRADVPTELVEHERGIVEELTRAEGKPEAALPKIVEGRLHGFFKQIVLEEQDYARDTKLTVKKVLAEGGLKVVDFARIRVGVKDEQAAAEKTGE